MHLSAHRHPGCWVRAGGHAVRAAGRQAPAPPPPSRRLRCSSPLMHQSAHNGLVCKTTRQEMDGRLQQPPPPLGLSRHNRAPRGPPGAIPPPQTHTHTHTPRCGPRTRRRRRQQVCNYATLASPAAGSPPPQGRLMTAVPTAPPDAPGQPLACTAAGAWQAPTPTTPGMGCPVAVQQKSPG
jgi:hypothetical protein